MRKKVFGKKLGRGRGARTALFRSLIISFVVNGKLKTTKSKIKAVQPEIDKLMKLVRKNDLSSRRLALARLGNDGDAIDKLFSDYKEHASARNSGFTRMKILGKRQGDNTDMALLEWVIPPEKKVEKKAVKKIKNKA